MSKLEAKEEEIIVGGVPLSENYAVIVEPLNKEGKAKYVFKRDNSIVSELEGVIPIRMLPLSAVAKEIKKFLDPDGKYNPKALNNDFDKIKEILQEQYESSKLLTERLADLKKQEAEQYLNNQMKEAENTLKSINQPVLWVASLIEWLTAGERNNILLAFVAYASQVILKNPISVIGLGEGGSGKTHIHEIALSFIPDEFIVDEKKISEAAMFNRAKEDPYFYDGKIVDYGDLGGVKDQDFIMESKNLLKELQSDGKLNKPLSVNDKDGNWVTRDLRLLGKPCLTYTTVPGHKFDDQEKSRSIFITPRMDNKNVFNKRQSMLEMRGRTFKEMRKYENESNIIQYVVYHLRDVLKEVTIVNPYISIVIDFLSESDYFKRDFDKYNGILKTITALNYYNKEVHENDDGKVIYSSLEDVQLFFSLLKPYHESITYNISPKATEILIDLRDNISKWESYSEDEKDQSSLDTGITVNEYFEKQELKLTKRSIQRYFTELNNEGFIKNVGGKKNSTVWNLTGNVDDEVLEDMLVLSEEAIDSIAYEIGEDVKDTICRDNKAEGLDINVQYPTVEIPAWNKWDKDKYKLNNTWETM